MRICSATKGQGRGEVSNFAHTPQNEVNECLNGLIDCAWQTTDDDDDDMRQFPQQAGLVQRNVKTVFRAAKHLGGPKRAK